MIELDEHFADADAARRRQGGRAIQDDLERLAAEAEAREAVPPRPTAPVPSAGTSDGTADGSGSGSNQLGPTTVGQTVRSGGIGTGGSSRSSTTRGG